MANATEANQRVGAVVRPRAERAQTWRGTCGADAGVGDGVDEAQGGTRGGARVKAREAAAHPEGGHVAKAIDAMNVVETSFIEAAVSCAHEQEGCGGGHQVDDRPRP